MDKIKNILCIIAIPFFLPVAAIGFILGTIWYVLYDSFNDSVNFWRTP